MKLFSSHNHFQKTNSNFTGFRGIELFFKSYSKFLWNSLHKKFNNVHYTIYIQIISIMFYVWHFCITNQQLNCFSLIVFNLLVILFFLLTLLPYIDMIMMMIFLFISVFNCTKHFLFSRELKKSNENHRKLDLKWNKKPSAYFYDLILFVQLLEKQLVICSDFKCFIEKLIKSIKKYLWFLHAWFYFFLLNFTKWQLKYWQLT